MASTLARKIGIRAGKRAILVRAPADVRQALAKGGARFTRSLTGKFDYIHAFFTTQAQVKASFRTFQSHLAPGGMLWISWPKKGQLKTDLSLTKIIGIGYKRGLVESKTIGVNDTWSAIKFTWPKAGKTYKNSFGTLPGTR